MHLYFLSAERVEQVYHTSDGRTATSQSSLQSFSSLKLVAPSQSSDGGLSLIADVHVARPNAPVHLFFFAAAALALAAFFLLLLIITMPKKEPTTAEPSNVRITGIRMAQTRGGKRLWSGWSSSTNGCPRSQLWRNKFGAECTMNRVHSV